MKSINKESSINRAIGVAESFAVTYGLMNPDDPNPLSLVCDTDIEGLDQLSGWDLRIDQYSRLKIGVNFQLSIVEFLNLPRRMITKLISAAESIEAIELKKQNEAKAEIERQMAEGQYPQQHGFQHTVPKLK